MGVRLWTADPVPPELRPTAERRGLAGVFLTGVALNLGNPKMPPCEGGAAVREEAADGNGDGPEPVEPSRGGPVRESHKIYYGT